jgi:hypothetical protein
MIKTKFAIIFLFLCSSVLITGLISEPSLGDEVYHYRFAKNFCWQGKRPLVDILHLNSVSSKTIYSYDALWHMTLSLVWRATGCISSVTAQIYQTFYYSLLVFFTYLLGKELYDKETGLYSAVIVATVPMISVFSVLYYIDVPVTAFCVLCILLVVKNRFLWAGVVLGLMFICKKNSMLFVPAILFIIFYYDNVKLKIKFRNVAFMVMVAYIVVLPDLHWRKKNLSLFPPTVFGSSKVVLNKFAREFNKYFPKNKADTSEQKHNTPPPSQESPENKYKMAPVATKELGDMKTFSNMIIKNYGFLKYFKRLFWLSYFGFTILFGIASYLIFKRYQKKDVILWALVVTYLLFFLHFVGLSDEVRYTLPIVPFLSILAAIPIATINKKYVKNTIIFICIAQFLMAVGYLGAKRQVSRQIKDGFAFIKEYSPQDATLFYVEYLAMDRTNRKIKFPSPSDPLLRQMFWSPDAKGVLEAMNQMGIDYIMVKKSRIYDDSQLSYFHGYPKSFTERLTKLSFLRQIFDNKDMSIWQVSKAK